MTGKRGMAEEEKGRRAYRETYGRGGGEPFDDRDYPQSYGAPGAMDWRAALRAYVAGHDRGWESERKEREAAAGPGHGTGEGGEGGREAATRTAEGAAFGVSVPERDRLAFHRSASVWRDRLPDARRLPRHTDRRLDTAPGRGGQA